MTLPLVALGSTLFAGAFGLTQVNSEAPTASELNATFELPDGLEVELWAESPGLFNPAAIDVDARGRVWVAEAVNYRQWSGRNPGKHHDGGDRIVILEDEDGDGVAESSKVFVQDPDLTAPLGIALVGNRVYVSCSPNLYAYVDEDGDDVPDRRETILTGFGGFNHDHGLHSVVPHADGKLYVAVGNAGPHMVTGPDGRTLRSGSIYRGGGPKTADNMPGLISDDGKAWTGGLVLRMDHDGSNLEVMAHNFRNIYEVAVNANGEMFTADNDDDGNRSCRTTWVMPGGNYGFFSADGTRTWQADERPGMTTQEAHWHQRDPGVVPAGTINGAGGPTGVCVYEGTLMERWIGDAVLNCDAGARVVYAHKPRSEGAGIALDPGFLIRTRQGSNGESGDWFRPSDVAVGPGGEVYVADWYDPGVGGHAARDRKAYGRILRIVPKGASVAAPALNLETPDGVLAAFHSPAVAVRELGRQRLVRLGEVGARTAAVASQSADPRTAARLAQYIGTQLKETPPIPARSTEGENVAIEVTPLGRVLILHALTRRDTEGTAATLLADGFGRLATPAVKREILQGLRGKALEGDVLELVLEVIASTDGSDPWLLEAIGQLFEADADEWFAELSASFGETPLAWDARFEALAWRLHPESATVAWAARAMAPQLGVTARRRALDALAFTPGRSAADAVMLAATAGPEDLRSYAAWWIENRSGNDWRDYQLRLKQGALEDAQVLWESPLMRAGSVSFDIDVSGIESLWLTATDGGDGNSCDWIAWENPRFVAEDGTEVSMVGTWLEADSGWGRVGVHADAMGDSLEIGERSIPVGIGAHAPSLISYSVPKGAVRLVGGAGPERNGTSQNGGASTSVVFQVQGVRAAAPKPLAEWFETAQSVDKTAAERMAAAESLAEDHQGALMLIHAKDEGLLSEELAVALAPRLLGHPELAVRALASAHFAVAGEGGATPPSIPELMALTGDAARGRVLFQDAGAASCITCHAYQEGDTRIGLDLGPELTHIGKKLTGEALFDAILNPSASIAFGYDTYVVETSDGLLHSGFLLADGPTVALLATDGERIVLDADEVVGKKKQSLSTMPAGLALDLQPQDLADLVAFLAEGPSAEPSFGEEVVLFDGSSMDAWTFHLSDASKTMDDVWSVKDGVLRCGGRPAGYLKTRESFEHYELTLEWRFDPGAGPGNSGVLLRMTGADKVWPRSIEAQLQHRSAGDFWNIDKVRMSPDPSRTRGRNTRRAAPSSERPLGEWNHYRILVNGPRVELWVNGVLQNAADWCEEVAGPIGLQSEGAVIEFRNVKLRPILR